MKFIYTLIGDYPLDHLRESLRCLRRFAEDADTELWTDRQRDVRVGKQVILTTDEYSALSGVEASDRLRVRALMSQDEVCCYLDSDIYVVSTEFARGFDIAKVFGMAMPANPRSFVCCAHGAGDMDMSVEDADACFSYWTPVNLGMIFYEPSNIDAQILLAGWNKNNVDGMKPRAAFMRATLSEGWHPYILAQQFCADAVYQNMLAMHVGGKYHAHMLEHYNTYHRA